jgi:hypothetical protein
MGSFSTVTKHVDLLDGLILVGFACIVAATAIKYSWADALFVFGGGCLAFGLFALTLRPAGRR